MNKLKNLIGIAGWTTSIKLPGVALRAIVRLVDQSLTTLYPVGIDPCPKKGSRIDNTQKIFIGLNENSQELTQFNPRSHPRHSVGKRTPRNKTHSETSPATAR